MQKILSQWNTNQWISNLLLVLLLSTYIVIIYVIVAIAGTLPFGGLHDPFPLVLSRVSRWLDLIGFLVVGITLLPVSWWLSVRIHDLVYAQDDALSVLSSCILIHLQNMTSPQLTLPAVIELIAHTLQLPFVEIETTDGDPILRYAVGHLTDLTRAKTFPIAYLNNPIGALHVCGRAGDQALPENYVKLLNDIAQQLGIALRAAQLTTELQTSRERLVVAREEERRRIRNDLHDGLAPTLSSLQLQLGAVRNLIRQNPEQAEAMINELREEMRDATGEIRQLVYDLRPPMLDELGLVGAMRNSRFQGSEVSIEVNASEPMPQLSAAVEVAVYRIASEALHNVVKHAQATACVIDLEVDGGCLVLKVSNNGKSIPADAQAGVGLTSMKERAAELGGTLLVRPIERSGTCVLARIPLESGCKEA